MACLLQLWISMKKVTQNIVCLFDSLKTRPSVGVRPSLKSLLWSHHYCITVSLWSWISLRGKELDQSWKLTKRIQEVFYMTDPTWSKEETEELRDLLKLPSFSSPLLPVTALARDFCAVGVFTWFFGGLSFYIAASWTLWCEGEARWQIIRLTLGFSEAAPDSSSSFFSFSPSPFSSFFSAAPPTWL